MASDALEAIAATARQLEGVASSLTAIAANIGSRAGEATVAARRSSEEATASAGRVGELLDSAAAIHAQVEARRDAVMKSLDAAERGQNAVQALDRAAAGIGMASASIGRIAGHSRMLALNAQIEAARAGEAGRGFAVVAGEVRDLSAKTSMATTDIDGRLGTLQRGMEDVVPLFGANLAGAQDMGLLMDEVTAVVAGQRSAANDAHAHCARAMALADEAATNLGRLATAAATIAMLADQVKDAASQLAAEADGLGRARGREAA